MNRLFSPTGRKKKLKIGDIPDPPPAYTTDNRGRPRLTDAFTAELKESVRHIHSNHDTSKNKQGKKKRNRFSFLTGSGGGGKKKEKENTAPNVDPQTLTWTRNTTKSSRKLSSKDDLPILSPSKTQGESKPSSQNRSQNVQTGEEKKSDTPETLKATDRSPGSHLSTSQSASRNQTKPKTLTKAEADELKRSFHDEMIRQDSHRVRKSRPKEENVSASPRDPPPTQESPPSTKRSESSKKYKPPQSPIQPQSPQQEGVMDQARETGQYDAPNSITDRDQQRQNTDSYASPSNHHFNSSSHNIQSVSEPTSERIITEPPSINGGNNKKKNKKRATIQIPEKTSAKSPSQPASTNPASGKRSSLQRKMSRYKKGIQQKSNDTPTLAESGQERELFASFEGFGEQSEKEAFSLFPDETNNGFDSIRPKKRYDRAGEDNDLELSGDFESYKAEWGRLIKTKQTLKAQLNSNEMKVSLLEQQVEGLTSQTKDLKLQRDHWQGKATKLKKLHQKERVKFDTSTDLIAQARVELTKSLNEASTMRSMIHQLETKLKTKDRRVEELDDTVQFQGEKLDDMAGRLVDKEAELRIIGEEKRKIEDELAVLIVDRDGEDIQETFRQLEQEREQWLWQREQDLEVKRGEVQKENSGILEREKQRHRQEMERIAEESQQTARLTEEQEKIQEFINHQLEEMKAANIELQEKLTEERLESNSELENQEKMIIDLEHDILDLKRQLTEVDTTDNRNSFTSADMESARDDLRDATKQNKLLEQEIERLTKELKNMRTMSNDWREIVLPGHRGVTFGDPRSDSLVGFLTILVEQQSLEAKKNTKGTNKSIIDLRNLETTTQKKKKAKTKQPTKIKTKKKKPKANKTKKKKLKTESTKKKKLKTKSSKKKVKTKKGKPTKKKTTTKKKKPTKKVKKKKKTKIRGRSKVVAKKKKRSKLKESSRGRKSKREKVERDLSTNGSMVPLKRGQYPQFSSKDKTKTRRSRTLSPKRNRSKSYDHHHHHHGHDDDDEYGRETYEYYRTDRGSRRRSRSQPPRTIFLETFDAADKYML